MRHDSAIDREHSREAHALQRVWRQTSAAKSNGFAKCNSRQLPPPLAQQRETLSEPH